MRCFVPLPSCVVLVSRVSVAWQGSGHRRRSGAGGGVQLDNRVQGVGRGPDQAGYEAGITRDVDMVAANITKLRLTAQMCFSAD